MLEAEPGVLADWVGGRVAGRGATAARCHGLTTDTRRLAAGNAFVCLRGPHFDGHRFAHQAAAAGAVVIVAERELDVAVPQVIVDDARVALGRIGAHWRRAFSLPVIAVTGSNGKTTVKECIAAIMRQSGPTLATRGNLNNDIGVPLMLCELAAEHRAAVFELGANHAGEIATLTGLVGPAIGVLTNAGAAHLEGFGSIAGVARAKGELIEHLPGDGCAVFPADSEWTPLWRELAGARRQLAFGADERADVRVGADVDGRIRITIGAAEVALTCPLPGVHNRRNAAAAAAAAHAAGVPLITIAAGLASVEAVPGRLVERRGPAGARILDDSYNANPGSFAAAMAVLAEIPGQRWAVVGEMAELGAQTVAAHEALGDQMRQAGVERLWACGPSACHTCRGFGRGAQTFDDPARLGDELRGRLGEDVVLLVKGSRTNALERLVEHLLAAGEG